MRGIRHVCLFNTDSTASERLLKQLTAGRILQSFREVDDPGDLAGMIRRREVNLIFVHLDPDPSDVLEVVDQLSIRHPEIPLIGVSNRTDPEMILAALRAGCDQFICEPISQDDLAGVLSRIASKGGLGRKAGRCICVTGASGGAGATSIACGLAHEIGQLTGNACALVDLELQFGTVAVTFDCEPKYSFYDLAEEQAEGELDRWVVEEALTVLPGNVAILPRPETAKQQRAVTPEVIGRVVDLLTDTYENVIIDMPRRIDPCTIAVMERADLVLVVCQLMVPSVGNAKRYLDMAAYARVPASNLEVLVNRYDSSGSLITLNDVERTIQKPIYGKIPNDYKSVSKFLDLGQPAVSLKVKNSVRAAMEVIAHKVAHGGANVSLTGA